MECNGIIDAQFWLLHQGSSSTAREYLEIFGNVLEDFGVQHSKKHLRKLAKQTQHPKDFANISKTFPNYQHIPKTPKHSKNPKHTKNPKHSKKCRILCNVFQCFGMIWNDLEVSRLIWNYLELFGSGSKPKACNKAGATHATYTVTRGM